MIKPKIKTALSSYLTPLVSSWFKVVLILVTLTGVFLYTRAGVPTRVEAATSSSLNFQARLLTSGGGIVADGTYNVEFKLSTAALPDGGETPIQGACTTNPGAVADEDCVWVETRTGGNVVTVKNGYLSVSLGDVTAFGGGIDWDQDLYLSMNIGGIGSPSWDGEMTPRLKLTAVPYAFNSAKLGGIASSGFAQLAPAAAQTVNSANTAISLNQTGAGNLLQLQGNGSDVLTLSKTGNLVITGAGTLSTGTGAISLNGATTVTGSNTFTSGTGTVQLQGNTNVAATASFATQRGADYTTAGSANDVAISVASLYRLDTSGAAQTITGIVAGRDGQTLTLVNVDAALDVIISNNSGSSLAANRIITGTSGDLTLPAGASLNLIYDAGASLWRVVGTVAVTGGTGANQQLSNLSGTIAVNASLTTNADNTLDLGSSSYSWRTLYTDTSVLTPAIDVASAGTLTIGNSTATAVSICNSAACDTISIGTNADADTITIGDSLDSIGLNGSITGTGTYTFSGVTTDITTGTNEDLTIIANGTGVINLTDTVYVSDRLGLGDPTPDFVLDVEGSLSAGGVGSSESLSKFTYTDTGVVTSGNSVTKALEVITSRTGATGGTTLAVGGDFVALGDTGGSSTVIGSSGTASGGDISIGVSGAGYITGAGVFDTVTGISGGVANILATGATVTNAYGIDTNLNFTSGASTITNAVGLNVNSATNGGSTITSNYGIRVENQTIGGTDYGIWIEDAADYSLYLASTDGDAASGITFGGDTNLYRSAASTLRTDDALTIAGLLTGQLGANISGATTSINASSNFATNINTGTSTGAVSIGNSLAGAVTLVSGSSIDLTGTTNINNSGTAGTSIGNSTGALALTGSSSSSFVLNSVNVSAAEFNVLDAGIESADLTTQGTATDEYCLTYESGGGAFLAWQDCGANITLQSVYNTGNTITTTDNRNIAINLADTATDSDFIVDILGTGNIFEIRDSGTAALTVADGGFVGIGDSTPDFKLDVEGSSTAGGAGGTEVLSSINFTDTGNVTSGNDYSNGLSVTTTRTGATGGSITSVAGIFTSIGDTGGTSTASGVQGGGGGADINYGVNGLGYIIGSGTYSTSVGVNGAAGTFTSSGATATSAYGLQGAFAMDSGTATVTRAAGLNIATATNGSGGTVTSNYGIRVENQTIGGTDYGIWIEDAADYSLYLASTDGDAASGITFGGDTNLYRDDPDILRTDDNFYIGLDAGILGGDLYLGSPSTTSGLLHLFNATNAFFVTVAAPNQTVGSAVIDIPNTAGVADVFCLLTVNNCSIDSSVTLQDAYTNGNTITTTDNRNIAINLADTATDSDFIVDILGTGNIFEIRDSGTAALTVADGGFVGIGDATPDFKLDVEGSSAVGGAGVNKTLSSLSFTDTGNITSGTDNVVALAVNATRSGATGGTVTTTAGSFTAGSDNGGISFAVAVSATAYGADTSSGVQGSGYITGTSTVTTVVGVNGVAATLFSSGAAAATSAYGLQGGFAMTGGVATVTRAAGLNITSAANGSGGTVTSNYGIRVENQTIGGTDYGIWIEDAADYSLYLASTDGDAASGITFGGDTNLYRSAASTLRTDDALTIAGLLTGQLGATVSGAAISLNDSSNFATSINGGTSTGTVNIGTGTGVQALNFGTGGTGAKTVTIGSTASTSSVTINTGTNGINIGTNSVASAIQIGNTTTSTGVTIRTGTGLLNFDTTNAQFTEVTGTRTLGVQTRTTNVAGTNLTVSAGAAGTGASPFSGGVLTMQGGAAGGTGTAHGGNVVLSGGAGTGSGVAGLVVINTPTFATASVQNFTGSAAITPASINGNGAILISSNAAGYTATMGDPTITTAGRIVYVTNSGSFDMTLSVNGGGSGNTITLKPNTSATMIWNGNDWTAAGASSSTDLQAAYNNTATSAGGAELVLNASGGAADGLTIRNNSTTPINGGILEVQSAIGTNLFSVNNLGTELAANGGSEDSSTFSTNWTAAPAGGTITRSTTAGQYVTGQAGTQVVTSAVANYGVRNNLSGNPVVSTTYTVSFTAKLSSGTFTTLDVRYSRDGGTDLEACSSYSTQTLSTSVWTKVTCTITTDSTTATNPDLIIRQTDATVRTFWIDNLSFIRNDATTQPSNVQIGGGINGGQVTLFTLDRASAPPVAAGDTTYLGSMYYDTVTGRIQCYESDGWGACGSAPDNIITLTPEYSGAVLNGSGVGTMTADFCSNEASVLVVGTLCANHEVRNFYRWTSPQASAQTYSIYVNYKLPSTFREFNSSSTMKLTALSTDTSLADATFQVFRKNVTGNVITSCGSATAINASNNTWEQTSFGGDETACGFTGGDYIVFKIDVIAEDNASIYIENLDFTYSNR